VSSRRSVLLSRMRPVFTEKTNQFAWGCYISHFYTMPRGSVEPYPNGRVELPQRYGNMLSRSNLDLAAGTMTNCEHSGSTVSTRER